VKAVRRKAAETQEAEEERLEALWDKNKKKLFTHGYERVSFEDVKDWLKVPPSVFTAIVEYCAEQPLEVRADGHTVAVTAVRVLWLAAHADGGDCDNARRKRT
jgi:hypothetical protein